MAVPLCPVCFQETRLESLVCSHEICTQCISKWIMKSASCPICRRTFDLDPKFIPATRAEIGLGKSRYRIGEAISVKFTLSGSQIPKNELVKVFVVGNKYFSSHVVDAPYQLFLSGLVVELPLQKQYNCYLEDLSKPLEASFFHNSKLLTTCFINFKFCQFTEDFFPDDANQVTAEQSVNILLLGPSGSGKSSFINAAFSMLSSKICLDIAPTGGTSNGTTKTLSGYRLCSTDDQRSTIFRLWDTPGKWNPKTDLETFQSLFLSKLSAGYPLGQESTKKCEPHSIIFFFSAETEIQEDWKEIVSFLKVLQIPFMAVISKSDLVGSKYEDITDNWCKKLYKIGIPSQRVYAFAANVNGLSQDIKVDILTNSILVTACTLAKHKKLMKSHQ